MGRVYILMLLEGMRVVWVGCRNWLGYGFDQLEY